MNSFTTPRNWRSAIRVRNADQSEHGPEEDAAVDFAPERERRGGGEERVLDELEALTSVILRARTPDRDVRAQSDAREDQHAEGDERDPDAAAPRSGANPSRTPDDERRDDRGEDREVREVGRDRADADGGLVMRVQEDERNGEREDDRSGRCRAERGAPTRPRL